MMKELIISLICLLTSSIAAMDDNNTTSPDINSTTPCTNYTLAKKSRGETLVLYLAAPIVPSLLVSHLAIRGREWTKAERAKKKKEVMELLYQKRYIQAGKVRKSKICTLLLGVSKKEFENMIDDVWDIHHISDVVQNKSIQAKKEAIERRNSVRKKSKGDLKAKDIAPKLRSIPENKKLKTVARKKQKT